PIFGSILILAASNPGQGLFYTVMYVIGFALPFFVLTFFLGSTKWIVKHSGIIMKFGAVIMIIMGLLLFFGLIAVIFGYLFYVVGGMIEKTNSHNHFCMTACNDWLDSI